jgi:hypothetical protein
MNTFSTRTNPGEQSLCVRWCCRGDGWRRSVVATTTISFTSKLKVAPLDDSLVYILPPCLVCKRNRRVFCSLKRVSNQMLDQRSVRQWEGVTRCEVSIVRIFVPTQKNRKSPIRGSRQQRPRFSPELHNSPDTVKSLFRNPFLKPEKRATSLDAV